MERIDEITAFLPERLRTVVNHEFQTGEQSKFFALSEIRLRVNCPLILMYGCREKIFENVTVKIADIRKCVEFLSDYSLFARHEDIKNGFITIKGGHRAGIAGQVVCDNKQIVNQKNISFINIRVAHEVVGCADGVMDFVLKNHTLKHTLIVSPPGCGKTTFLRDIVRQLSLGIRGRAYRVGVVDERSEIAACHEGVPQNDLGIRTDVLDQAPKPEGMLLMLRSMSPEVVAVDELGSEEDILAARYLMSCGCILLATIHGNGIEDLRKKFVVRELIGPAGFSRVIVLGKTNGVGTVEQIREVEA